MANKPSKQATKRTMTSEHKAAIAAGREQAKAVREYLDALESHKPKRGRRRTAEGIRARLAAIEAEVAEASMFEQLALRQEQADLETELEAMNDTVDITAFEQGFVQHARGYAEAKGISYATFRRVGVPADVLKKAGISRSM